jgi:hypothetical protein
MKLTDAFNNWLSEDSSTCDSLHRDLFTAANYLIEEGRPDEEIFDFMRQACNRVGERNVSDREIKSCVKCARSYKKGTQVLETWPKPDPVFQNSVINYYSDVNLLEIARLEQATTIQDSAHYIKELYDEDELVCLGLEMNRPVTVSRKEAIEYVSEFAIPYIVPSPMSEVSGLTEQGDKSPRTKANTGDRRYLVIEFDYAEMEQQLAYHLWLDSVIPCMFIVYSGGKSFHGWYNVENLSEAESKAFFTSAVKLGADRVTWSKCQLCRLPSGNNIKYKKQQTVIGRTFFDATE